MFGTLLHGQQKKPLVFVENTDLGSALSRSRRDKPHVSCEHCRTRKVRCSGQSTGCDRCVATGSECRYPPREPRRKKPSTGSRIGSLDPASRTGSCSDVGAEQKDQNHIGSQGHGDGDDGDDREVGGEEMQRSPDMFDLDTEFDYNLDGHQQAEDNWQSSYPVCGGNSNGDKKGEVDRWLNLDDFVDPTLMTSMEEHTDMFGDVTMESLLGDLEDGIPSTSTPDGPDRMEQEHSLLSSLSNFTLPAAAATALKLPSSRGQHKRPRHRLVQPSPSSSASTSSPFPMSLRKPAKQGFTSNNNGGQSRGSATNEGCRCLHLTACLLEELGAKSASNDPATMDVLLSYFRGALANCAAVIDCERCTSASENNMLLAMVGRYMSIICERIVACYASSTSSLGPWGPAEAASHSNSGGNDDMWFSTYRIEGNLERMQVLRCLVTVQLAEFWRLLEKLKARAGDRRGHLVLLTEAENRTRAVGSMLKASLGRQARGRGIL